MAAAESASAVPGPWSPGLHTHGAADPADAGDTEAEGGEEKDRHRGEVPRAARLEPVAASGYGAAPRSSAK